MHRPITVFTPWRHPLGVHAARESLGRSGPVLGVMTRSRMAHILPDALDRCTGRTTWLGRRDHALLLLAAQTGLRLSELISLDRDAIHLGAGAHVRCIGKGRKERCTPLATPTLP